MAKEIVFACPPEELSCLVGSLFSGLEPPCDFERSQDLCICGDTHDGSYGRLVIKQDYCVFYGSEEALRAVRNGVCIERRCQCG